MSKYVRIQCDRCGVLKETLDGTAILAEGWDLLPGEKLDLCPNCVASLEVNRQGHADMWNKLRAAWLAEGRAEAVAAAKETK